MDLEWEELGEKAVKHRTNTISLMKEMVIERHPSDSKDDLEQIDWLLKNQLIWISYNFICEQDGLYVKNNTIEIY